MYREILNDFEKWYETPNRKPLIVTGARGVGKTWACRDFGDGFFDNTIVFDLRENGLRDFLDQFGGGSAAGPKIDTFSNTLFIFENLIAEGAEEIIANVRDNAPCSFIIFTTIFTKQALALSDEYASVLKLYPLSFGEFLIVNNSSALASKIENQKNTELSETDLEDIIKLLKVFYVVGGMPKAVKCYLDTKDLQAVEEVKKELIEAYESDFEEIEDTALRKKVTETWKSIAKQLSATNKKFMYSEVKASARAREYESAALWLRNRGYIDFHYKIKEPVSPLAVQKDIKSFEAFLPDVGLLTTMYSVSYEDLQEKKDSILIKNGAVIEQFVYQELSYNKNVSDIYYWTSSATARIAFVFEDSGHVVPIDVNVAGKTKAQSLKVYKERYQTPMAVEITYERFAMENGMLNIPVYSIWNL